MKFNPLLGSSATNWQVLEGCSRSMRRYELGRMQRQVDDSRLKLRMLMMTDRARTAQRSSAATGTAKARAHR